MYSKTKERMPVSCMGNVAKSPREQNFHALRTSAEVKVRRNPLKCHELKNDDNFLKKRKKREGVSV